VVLVTCEESPWTISRSELSTGGLRGTNRRGLRGPRRFSLVLVVVLSLVVECPGEDDDEEIWLRPKAALCFSPVVFPGALRCVATSNWRFRLPGDDE